MRWVLSFLLASGLVCVNASSAFAATTNGEVHPTTVDTATWLVHQVGPGGFIPQADPTKPNLSVTLQAVTALASVKVYKSTAQTMLSYVNAHLDDLVVQGGVDDPGSLANLILADRALDVDPSALVTRLLATQQPSGLFGAADPTFDGAFRQGLSLLALGATSHSNAAGVTWLEAQQCADHLWTSFRSDTAQPCPAVDPNTFSGPDTNSTALAVLGLFTQGATTVAQSGVAALDDVRNAGGGWGFLADAGQSTDANSTGVVLQALRTVNGSVDAQGTAALAALVVGCNGAPADIGAIAFQPGAGGALVPDALASVQALPGLAGVALPLMSVGFSSTPPPAPCMVPIASSSTTVEPVSAAGGATTTTAVVTAPTTTTAELPRTGSSSAPIAVFGAVFIAAGVGLTGGARRRRA